MSKLTAIIDGAATTLEVTSSNDKALTLDVGCTKGIVVQRETLKQLAEYTKPKELKFYACHPDALDNRDFLLDMSNPSFANDAQIFFGMWYVSNGGKPLNSYANPWVIVPVWE